MHSEVDIDLKKATILEAPEGLLEELETKIKLKSSQEEIKTIGANSEIINQRNELKRKNTSQNLKNNKDQYNKKVAH